VESLGRFWPDQNSDDWLLVTKCRRQTSEPQVLATVYRQKGKAMVALASWSDQLENCHLLIDWKKLGLDPQKVTIEAPAIENFQPARTFKPGEEIPVEPGQGWLLIFKTSQSD